MKRTGSPYRRSLEREAQALINSDDEVPNTLPEEGSSHIGPSLQDTYELKAVRREKQDSDRTLVSEQGSRPTKDRLLGWTNKMGRSKMYGRRKHTQFHDDANRPIVRPVHGGPRGYPEVATFLDSDDNFRIFRRFGYIQMRLLLEKQDDLRILEEELDDLEHYQIAEVGEEYTLRTREDIDEPIHERRREVLYALEMKFLEYAKLIEAARKMTSTPKPDQKDARSLQNWMNNVKPLVASEAAWVLHEEDLIAIRAVRPSSWLETAIETLARQFPTVLRPILQSNIDRQKSGPHDDEQFFDRSRVEVAALTITAVLMGCLILAPMLFLWVIASILAARVRRAGGDEDMLAATMAGFLLATGVIFVTAFGLVVTRCTRATRWEVIFSTLSYILFLGIFAVVSLGAQQTTHLGFVGDGYSVFNMTVWNMTVGNVTERGFPGQLLL